MRSARRACARCRWSLDAGLGRRHLSVRSFQPQPWQSINRRSVCLGAGALVTGALSASALLEPKPDEAELPRTYKLEELEAYFRRRPWAVAYRCAEVLRETLPLLTALIWDWRSGALSTQDDAACRQRASEAREALGRLGPAFIKAGQALSIRPDLLPPTALKELQRLCDDCPAIPWSIAKATIEEELGEGVWEVLEVLPRPETSEEPAPVAAASLGQVYRWRRRSDGQVLAVKVQRPDMMHAVALDIFILRRVAAFVRFAVRQITNNRTDHVSLLDAWAKGTYAELDYEAEANNQEFFREELGRRLGGRVYVPEVCRELTTRRVLATEWVDGPRLADCSREVIRTLVPVGVECFLAQLLDMGVFHSDPHPGNLLVSRGRLVLIDFGLVAEIGQLSMKSMATATVHLISADYESLFDDLVTLELLPQDADRRQVLPPLKSVLVQGMRAGSDIKRRAKNFQSIQDDLSVIFYELPFQVPDYFALITRALAVLEGIALAGDPEFDIFWAAYPFALSRARSVLGSRRTAGLLSVAAASAAQQMTAEERANLWFSPATS
eukprot:gb/GFBE01065622.1/.p1 GENE.gb/GFBE01065622.1/~~gb/GFBE01065622.1/.p1  ORF type:complete len:555 (+),score=115.17 gb/GFBE01065622.1/:1-1665(+)